MVQEGVFARMSSPVHTFFATAFVENFPLKEMAAHYPEECPLCQRGLPVVKPGSRPT